MCELAALIEAWRVFYLYNGSMQVGLVMLFKQKDLSQRIATTIPVKMVTKSEYGYDYQSVIMGMVVWV